MQRKIRGRGKDRTDENSSFFINPKKEGKKRREERERQSKTKRGSERKRIKGRKKKEKQKKKIILHFDKNSIYFIFLFFLKNSQFSGVEIEIIAQNFTFFYKKTS